MTTLLIALISGVGFLVAYHTYGRWLGSKIFRLSADAICPSERLKDYRGRSVTECLQHFAGRKL